LTVAYRFSVNIKNPLTHPWPNGINRDRNCIVLSFSFSVKLFGQLLL